MTSTEVAPWSPEQLDTLKRTYLRGVPDAELALFAQVCAHLGLSPFRDEITIVGRSVRGTKVWRHQVQVAGRRLLAVRTGELRGYKVEWCGPHAPEPSSPLEWQEVWLDDAPPHAARVTVWREGWKPEGVSAVWPWRETLKFHAHNDRGETVGPWADMPSLMLAKVAESRALRLAFPDAINAEVAGEWDDADDEGSPVGRAGDAVAGEVGAPSRPQPSPVEASSEPMMTRGEAEAVGDYLRRLGITDRGAVRAYIGDALGREVSDTRTITSAEANRLLDRMRDDVDAAEAREALEPEPEGPPDDV